MDAGRKPVNWPVVMVLTAGVLAISTGAIFARLAMATAGQSGLGFSLVLAAARLSIASLLLIPTWRRFQHNRPTRPALIYAIAAGLCLALHFAAWITSLSYTSIAASVALVTTNPVWVSLLLWVWQGIRPGRITSLGIAIALGGGLVVALSGAGSSHPGSAPLWGNFLALLGSWLVSLYFLLGREAQDRGLGLGRYLAIANATAAIALLPLPALLGTPYTGYDLPVYGYMLLTALVPQLIGHTSFNWAMGQISPVFVTLAILFEPVGSSVLGYWIFGEIPGIGVAIGALVLIIGVAIAVWGDRRS